MKDNSQLLTFRSCPLQYRYKYLVGLEKIQEGEVEHDRNFGRAIHSALAEFYKTSDKAACIEAFKKDYPSQLDDTDMAKTQENGVILLEHYFKRYSGDFEKYKVLGVEERIDFKIAGKDFCVKCDTILQNLKYGTIYSLEHKTTSKSLVFGYWDQYDPNSQLCAQTAGIKSKYGECSGVIVDAMSFGFRKRAYKGEPAGFHMDFERMEFNLNESQLSLWQSSTIKSIKDIEHDSKEDEWAMNTNSCRFCSYKPICQAGWTYPEDEELILLNFQKKKNPLDYLLPEKENE